jgi:hypothetical protein
MELKLNNLLNCNPWLTLGMSKPKPTAYNLCMVDQTIVKPLGLIKIFRIIVHEIP